MRDKIWKVLAIAGISFLLFAFAVGVWGFFKRTTPKADCIMPKNAQAK